MKLWQKIVLGLTLTIYLFFIIGLMLVLIVLFNVSNLQSLWGVAIGVMFLLLVMGGAYGIGEFFSWCWKVQINIC